MDKRLIGIFFLIFLQSCSGLKWGDLEIGGVQKRTKKEKTEVHLPKASLDQFIGRYRFKGANSERAYGPLPSIKFCSRDSLFIEKNEFGGIDLIFRHSDGQYFYESLYFANQKLPASWDIEEDIETRVLGERITQLRKRVRKENGVKTYLEYLTSLERAGELLFYTYQVRLFKQDKLQSELVPQDLAHIHCAYLFNSYSSRKKKAHKRSMGH